MITVAALHLLLLEVILVVVFSVVPLCGSQDFRGDGFSLVPLLADFFLHLGRDLGLLVVLGEDGGPVLGARVGPLPVHGRRVVHLEKVLDQLSVRDPVRVEDDEERLGVARPPRTHGLVRGGLGLSASVSHAAVQQPFTVAPVLAVEFLQTPKAAPGEDGPLGVGGELRHGQGVGLEGHVGGRGQWSEEPR